MREAVQIQTTRDATDFLRDHDKIGPLLPSAMRVATLQKDCSAILPTLFASCTVGLLDAGLLTISVSNAAAAAKLKQQLPKLQDGLLKRGWQVNVIRLKVQVRKSMERPLPCKQLTLPAPALSALAELNETLESSPRNASLKTAICRLLLRHGK